MKRLVALLCGALLANASLSAGGVTGQTLGDLAVNTQGSTQPVFDFFIVLAIVFGIAMVVFGFIGLMRNKGEGGDNWKHWKWIIIGSLMATPTVVMAMVSETIFGSNQIDQAPWDN